MKYRSTIMILIFLVLVLNMISYAANLNEREEILNIINKYTVALEKKDFNTLKKMTTDNMYKKTQEYFKRINNILFADKLFLEKIEIDNNIINTEISVGYIEYYNVSFFSKSSQYNRPVYITLKNINGNYYISETNIYKNKDIPFPIITIIAVIFLFVLGIIRFKRLKETGKIF